MRLLRHPKILTDNSPKLHRLSTKPKANAAMLVSLKHHNGFTLMKLLQKMKGDAQSLPPLAPTKGIALAGLGGVIAMSLLGLLGATTQTTLVLGSFGASCVLLFGFPDVPFSQPRNIVAGHFLSSLIGLAFLKLLGPSWWAMGLATGTAISVMMMTRTVHPPAGSNPVIVFLSQPSWEFLLFPTLIGASVLVPVGLLFHNSTREARYPKYWLGGMREPLFRLDIWKTIPATLAISKAAALVALVAVVVGGAIWGYLGKSGTEPGTDLSQMMEQATDVASEATDAASEAVESVAEGASDAASTVVETTEETIGAIGEEIQTQTDAALGGVTEGTDTAGQVAEQAPEGAYEPYGAVGEPAAPGTSVAEGTTTAPAIAAPEMAPPAAPPPTVGEPVATPTPEQIAPLASETSAATETLAVTEPVTKAAVPEPTSTAAGSETITVKPGEYLYSIAKRVYGDASKWRLIYDANRDQLSNPDAVRVGMKLVVPAAN
jgi:nucleoid-associated protein YgaU